MSLPIGGKDKRSLFRLALGAIALPLQCATLITVTYKILIVYY
ncbi:hypothetical protein [Halotia branconii]|uniref:Uncharacterized protein n=1 Tax=Halotia branconii CENA392 TaxID=1539056 RepID=A0AAJ6PA16_9CYAN|nr:hypothetical protein [Halotia branconii]WGV26325.1 hypothetical protein QI031_02080 [Halotia branconii CENA392]